LEKAFVEIIQKEDKRLLDKVVFMKKNVAHFKGSFLLPTLFFTLSRYAFRV
jgi:hypothetical protein